MRFGRLFPRFMAAAAACTVAGFSLPAYAETKPIVVGMAVAKSGFMTAYDEDPSRAVEVAVEDINAKGGILGRPLKLIWSDTKTDPAQAFKAGTDLVQQGADFVVVSCDFDMGGPAALASQNAGVLAISICSGSPKFGPQGVGDLVYTISVAVQAEGYLLAEWAKNKQKWNSVYILKDEAYTYTRAQCAGFEQRWKEIAGADSIVGMNTFKNDDPSIAAQITQLKASARKPDFVMVCSMMPGAPSVVRQLRNAGIEAPITLGFSMDGDYWLKAIPNVSNVFLPVHGSVFGDDPNPAVNELIARLDKKYGAAPTTSYALMGYSLMQAYARAVERAGSTDSVKVAAQLNEFKDEPLLIGPRSFSKDVHIQTKVRGLIMEAKNGKLVSTGEYYANEKPVPFESLFKE